MGRPTLTCVTGVALCGLFAGTATAGYGASPAAGTQRVEGRLLQVGQPVERELKTGEAHAYRIPLTAGQYVSVAVAQRGIDVVLYWRPPGAETTQFFNPNGRHDTEALEAVAEIDGDYLLLVMASDYVPLGRYEARLEAVRPATARDRVVATAWSRFTAAKGLLSEESFDEALPLAEEALRLFEQALGPDSPRVAATLDIVAVLREVQGEFDLAERLYKRSLAIYEKAFGATYPDIATVASDLGALYVNKRDFAAAEAWYRRAIEIEEKAYGHEDIDLIGNLDQLVSVLSATGAVAKAEPLLLRGLSIREKWLGRDHKLVAEHLVSVARFYRNDGAFEMAEPFYLRLLETAERKTGRDSPDAIACRFTLVDFYCIQGAFAKADPHAARMFEVVEAKLSPDAAAGLLFSVAAHFERHGAYSRAEAHFARVLALGEKGLGPDHLDVATYVNALARVCQSQGRYARAEPLYERALAIRVKALGQDHADVGAILGNLGSLYWVQGALARAEQMTVRALETQEKALAPDDPRIASTLDNLAGIYRSLGADAKAEPLMVRSLAIFEKAHGPDHEDVATCLSNLGGLYQERGDYARAEQHLARALKIREKLLGPEHPDVAVTLDILASLSKDQGDLARAEQLYQRALAIAEKANGPDNFEVAVSLHNLTGLYRMQDAYDRAEKTVARAVSILEKTVGPGHYVLAHCLGHASMVFWGRGDTARAVEYQARAGDVREREFLHNLTSGSERAKLSYIAQTAFEQDVAISLHVRGAPTAPEARRVAMETIVRRKGRALDVMSDSIAALRRRASPEDRLLLDELAETRARRTALTLQGARAQSAVAHRADLEALDARVEQLEARVSARSAEFRAAATPVSLDAVRANIPEGATLVEFASFRAYDPKRGSDAQARYVVYVARRSGEIAWADLGDAAKVDATVTALRAALRDPESDVERDVRPRARELDELVLRPVRKLASDSRRLLVAPDGALNLVPFDALVDESGRFAVEGYEISYLSSGRDLLRLAGDGASSQPATVLANPDFGPLPAASDDRRDIEHEASTPAASILARVFFKPLAGTAAEADALRAILPKARILTGAEVTKRALEQLDAPRILHVATHGFFLAAHPAPPVDARELDLVAAPDGPKQPQVAAGFENPLLRSGLALAGANLHRDGEGILTAYEVSGLRLWGTDLVVLSACDTGVGEVRTGDGVYGLRRALVLAGSETQVMSLWPVSDAATRDLMVDYYKGLVAGAGRSEAIRRVRLAMLRDPARSHPYYWASFIQSGAWGPIAP